MQSGPKRKPERGRPIDRGLDIDRELDKLNRYTTEYSRGLTSALDKISKHNRAFYRKNPLCEKLPLERELDKLSRKAVELNREYVMAWRKLIEETPTEREFEREWKKLTREYESEMEKRGNAYERKEAELERELAKQKRGKWRVRYVKSDRLRGNGKN